MVNLINIRCFLVVSCLLLVVSCLGCGDLESELSSMTISPSNPSIGINATKLFSVTAIDSLGFYVYIAPTWGISGGIGSINASGLFTAGSTTGEGKVLATYGTITASTDVIVTDKCWIEGKVRGDQDTGGVGNITVSLIGTSLSDLTDSSGDYSISGISAGTYNVEAKDNRANPIYQASTQEVTVASGETKTVPFFLTVSSGYTPVPTTTIPTF